MFYRQRPNLNLLHDYELLNFPISSNFLLLRMHPYDLFPVLWEANESITKICLYHRLNRNFNEMVYTFGPNYTNKFLGAVPEDGPHQIRLAMRNLSRRQHAR